MGSPAGVGAPVAVKPWHSRASPNATAFGAASADYDRYRPEPAAAVLDWLLREEDRDIVDVGAGTGQLTGLLVARGARVTAVEPDAGMRATLVLRVPEALTVPGAAERLPLPTDSQDAVLSHAAWHWFHPRRAVAEAARVLRPSGRLGVLSTGFDPEVDWLSDLWDRLEPDPAARRPGGRHHRLRSWAAVPGERWRQARSFGTPGAPFARQEARVVRFTREFTAAELVGLMGTYSGVIVRTPTERAAILERVREFVERHPRLGKRDAFEVPMVTRCWRAERR